MARKHGESMIRTKESGDKDKESTGLTRIMSQEALIPAKESDDKAMPSPSRGLSSHWKKAQELVRKKAQEELTKSRQSKHNLGSNEGTGEEDGLPLNVSVDKEKESTGLTRITSGVSNIRATAPRAQEMTSGLIYYDIKESQEAPDPSLEPEGPTYPQPVLGALGGEVSPQVLDLARWKNAKTPKLELPRALTLSAISTLSVTVVTLPPLPSRKERQPEDLTGHILTQLLPHELIKLRKTASLRSRQKGMRRLLDGNSSPPSHRGPVVESRTLGVRAIPLKSWREGLWARVMNPPREFDEKRDEMSWLNKTI